MDMVYIIFRKEGVWAGSRPRTHEFIKIFKDMVRAKDFCKGCNAVAPQEVTYISVEAFLE